MSKHSKHVKLGDHQLYLGDCLKILDRVEDNSIDMVLTDLPYGMTRNRWDCCIPLTDLWSQYHRVCKSHAAMVFTAMQPFSSALVASNPREFRYELVWDKCVSTGFLNARRQPLRRHENIVVFYRHMPTYNPQMTRGEPYKTVTRKQTSNYGRYKTQYPTISNGDRYPVSIIRVLQGRYKDGHPTQKPVALFEYLIRTFTNPGDVVLDNCVGSGTTLIACENTSRRCVAIELEPDYYRMTIKRYRDA